jgi:protein-L-isoaspartate(D-aspartate) O-methyltransferase
VQRRDDGVVDQDLETDRHAGARRRMVEVDLAGRDIVDPRVLTAMGLVPRHLFVDDTRVGQAYEDRALPIGRGQTISQPYIVAFTIQALSVAQGDRVLEVGTGSGYAAAVLAEMGAAVVTVERDPDLASTARSRLDALGYGQVEVIRGDGSMGRLDRAPFDAITVAAAAPSVPEPLVTQLRVGGRLVVPVGGRRSGQNLIRVVRTGEGTEVEDLLQVAFVPLVGQAGWSDSQIGPRRGALRRNHPR